MILQSIGWPDRIEDRELFYRADGTIELEPKAAAFHLSGHTVSFDTYFNAFSLGKWKKYTHLKGVALSLELKGEAEITLNRLDLHGKTPAYPPLDREPVPEDFKAMDDQKADITALHTQVFACEEYQTITLPYEGCNDADGISFSVRPISETAAIRRAAYVTVEPSVEASEVNIALAICTYKREAFVTANMDMLRREVFENPESQLNGHLQVYIADNGQTLDAHAFAGLPVHVFPNLNSGGSGGFSRAAIEAIHDEAFNATHVILMDDDISFNAWSLERNYTFLRLLRSEYSQCHIGGSMLNADFRTLLYSAGDGLTLERVTNYRMDWDMADVNYVIRLITDVPSLFFAWWYCCVPVALLRKRQFSMPFFVQFDDVEFGLRCGDSPKIYLNGLCCWHVPLERKDSPHRCYYSYRNFSVTYGVYCEDYTAKYMKKKLTDDVIHAFFTYYFNDAHMMMRGAEDFLKGPEWLIVQNPASLNQRLLADADKVLPVEDFPVPFDREKMLMNKDINQNRLRRYLRWLTLNGWLLPARRSLTIVEKKDAPMQYFFRAGTVLKYDRYTGKAMLAKRSYKEAFKLFRHLIRTRKAIDKGFDQAVSEYKARHDEMTSEAFWREFLGF